jgi:hypothetical protein
MPGSRVAEATLLAVLPTLHVMDECSHQGSHMERPRSSEVSRMEGPDWKRVSPQAH